MDRLIDLTLKLSLAKMMVEHFAPIHYYWWAAVAFFGATLALSAAIRLRSGGLNTTRT